jgi:hypothetical protein
MITAGLSKWVRSVGGVRKEDVVASFRLPHIFLDLRMGAKKASVQIPYPQDSIIESHWFNSLMCKTF